MPENESEKKEEAKERSAPTGAVVYEAIHEEGVSELERSSSALAWSGLAAGLGMGFCFLVPAYLHSHLPSAKWAPLVTSFGYTIGFLLVILGRQQLFTENTLTVILPLLKDFKARVLGNVLRLWVVVLLANLAGALIFAAVLAKTHVVDEEVFKSLTVVAREAMHDSFAITVLRGIVAGWLVATLVWLLPFAETARVWVIIILTYIIGLGRLSHVIAGAVEAAFLAFTHQRTWIEFALGFFLPALIGNILGGVMLVAALNHAQVVSGGDQDT
jgi:formate-nitrite transporter family protein